MGESLPGFFYKEQLVVTEKPNDSDYFFVEKILKTKTINKEKYYFCRFLYYPGRLKSEIFYAANTLAQLGHLDHLDELLNYATNMMPNIRRSRRTISRRTHKIFRLLLDKFNLWLPASNFKKKPTLK